MLWGAAFSVLSLGLPHVSPASAAGVTTVFVAGASGNTGRRVVRELRNRGLTVRAGVRDVEKARATGLALDDKVVLVAADVTQAECEPPALLLLWAHACMQCHCTVAAAQAERFPQTCRVLNRTLRPAIGAAQVTATSCNIASVQVSGF